MSGWRAGNPKRGLGRFEVRVKVPALNGSDSRSVYTRTSKLEIGLMALAEIARTWANSHGQVRAGTTADLIDTNDGGPVAQIKWLGFESGTLDDALNTLRANGFPVQEVPQPGEWLAGNNQRR